MKLRSKQSEFAHMVSLLIHFAYLRGYEITLGDAWAHDRHKKGSFHYKRLAIDINLFLNGHYLKNTKAHKELGEYWESLHPRNRWGGRWEDGNHYEHTTKDWR